MILAVVIGVSGFLMFQGFRLPSFTQLNDPEQLTAKANQVRAQIRDENRTATIVDGRQPTLDVIARAEAIGTPVDASPYKFIKPLQLKRSGATVRRQDPQIKPPRSIMTTSKAFAIAWQNRQSKDPDDYELFRLESADNSDDADRSRPRTRSTRRPRPGEEADEDDDSGWLDDAQDRGRSPSESNSFSGPQKSFQASNSFGVEPRSANGNPPIPYLARFIIGAAVVPHKEIYEAYNLALKDSTDYLASRDIPIYTNLEVQRAEVTDKSVDQLTEEDWTLVWTYEEYRKVAAYRWAGYANEIVPPEYRDANNRLSLWIPPVLIDDYRPYVTHPLIPLLSPAELAPDDDEEVEPTFNPGNEELFGAGNSRPVISPTIANRAGALGRRGDTRDGMSRLGNSGSAQDTEAEPVDYKLIRFYDFPGIKPNGPKPGSKYVYRVRYSVVDPNFPALRENSPKLTSLAPEVARRVIALNEDAARTGYRDFQKWSPWSEPSEPTSLPELSQQFVGPVDPGSLYDWTLADKRVEYARNSPKGTVVTSQFDENYATRVPFVMEVGEGSVLSQQGDADVVDPISMTVKKLPDARVINKTTIVDLQGGKPLSIFENMNEPGTMLLFGSDGKLTVANEINDMEFYRIHSYEEDLDP